MTTAEALIAVRSSTAHDADTQVTDAQLTVKLDQEYKRFRRFLVNLLPSLYVKTMTPAPTIAAGGVSFAKPTDFERIHRLEKLSSGTTYYPLNAGNKLGINGYCTYFEEQGANIVIGPDSDAPGTYRLMYVPTVGTYTGLDLPEGLEDVVIERCAAWVRQRHDENPDYHLGIAREIIKEQAPYLVRRYGEHRVSMMVVTE